MPARFFPGREVKNPMGGVSSDGRFIIPKIECSDLRMILEVAAASDAVCKGLLVKLPFRPPWLRTHYRIMHLRKRPLSYAAASFCKIALRQEKLLFSTAWRTVRDGRPLALLQGESRSSQRSDSSRMVLPFFITESKRPHVIDISALTEPIADTGLRDYDGGFRWRVLYFLSKLTDQDAQVLDIIGMGGTPDGIQNLLVSQHPASVSNQE